MKMESFRLNWMGERDRAEHTELTELTDQKTPSIRIHIEWHLNAVAPSHNHIQSYSNAFVLKSEQDYDENDDKKKRQKNTRNFPLI